MAHDDRTIYDLSDEEYEDYTNHPEKYEDITDNTLEDTLDMMFDRDNDFNDDDDGLGSYLG